MSFKSLIGERINGLFIGNDNWTILFRTINGRYLQFNTENDCCNQVWFNHISGLDCITSAENRLFDLMAGAEVLSVEDKGWERLGSDEDEFNVIDDGFWTITTTRGRIDIEVRNSHNGYYGGNVADAGIYYSTKHVSGCKQVTDDF